MPSASITIFRKVYLKSLRNRILSFTLADELRTAFLIFISAAALAVFFLFMSQLFRYADSVFLIGPLLVGKFYSLAVLVFWWLVFFAGITSAYKHFYFQKDILSLLVFPIDWKDFFTVKFISVIKESALSGGILLIPFVAALGAARSAPPEFYFYSLAALIPLFVSASASGTFFVLAISAVFPAARSRKIVWTSLAAGFSVFYITARIMVEPLRSLLSASTIASGWGQAAPATPFSPHPPPLLALSKYISFMSKPVAADFPSGLYTLISLSHTALPHNNNMTGNIGIGDIGIFIMYALIPIVLCAFIFKKYYRYSFSIKDDSSHMVMTKTRGLAAFNGRAGGLVEKFLSGVLNFRRTVSGSFLISDMKNYLRDPSRWSQFALVAGLVVVYTISIFRAARSSDMVYLKMLVSFLGSLAGGVVCAALSLRFVFAEIAGRPFFEELRALNFLPVKFETVAREKFLTRAVSSALISWASAAFAILLGQGFSPTDKWDGAAWFLFNFSLAALVVLGSICFFIVSAAFYGGVIKMKNSGSYDSSAESSLEGIIFSIASLFYIVANFLFLWAYGLRRYYLSYLGSHDAGLVSSAWGHLLPAVIVLVVINVLSAVYFYKSSVRSFIPSVRMIK